MGKTPEPFDAARLLGDRIREHRKALGWTQERLAEASELHWTYVASVERGERNVSLRNILRLAQALDIGPETLVLGLRA